MIKIDDLLKVLDMDENQQCAWLCEYFKNRYYNTDNWPKWYGVCDILMHDTFPGRYVILADLAFSLRNELKNGYNRAAYTVFNYCGSQEKFVDNVFYWMACKASPIHWIITVLIAREENNDKTR